MLLAIVTLSIIGIVLELLAFLDLYATLQTNYKALGVAVFLASFIGLNEIWFAIDYSGSIWSRELIYAIVSIDITIAALLMLHFKKRLKNALRKKRISATMKTKWAKKKEAKYIIGADLASPNGDHSAVVTLKLTSKGTEIVDEKQEKPKEVKQ